MKEVLLPAQSFSPVQVRGEPYTSQVQISFKNLIKSRPGKKRISIIFEKKGKFLLKSDLKSRSTNFKPSLIQEISKNQLELLIPNEG